jgi:acetolactate synthase-1/2/3 large subunit
MDRYADQFMGWLKELGFTHCFFLAGGGSMHLVDAANEKFECIPVVHEVSAVIATEYFNESNSIGAKAFALVTTGPGLTNTITGIAGAWLESRDCLIVGGQVKKLDLAAPEMRQKGIQEVNGTLLVGSITKATIRIETPVDRSEIIKLIRLGECPRKGPVFIEICIDASAAPASPTYETSSELRSSSPQTKHELSSKELDALRKLLSASRRPLLLLGAGVSQKKVLELEPEFEELGIPIASTWSGADRTNSEYKYFAGRPNTYGMRWANVYQQQSDLLIAVGTRLNLQQTGFNYHEFMPVGKIVHVDLDPVELEKSNPSVDLAIRMDSSDFLSLFVGEIARNTKAVVRDDWIRFLEVVRGALPLVEDHHVSPKPYINPYFFITKLSEVSTGKDIVVSCSSGGTFTATHQSFLTKKRQQLISNKGLASMGYGLAGAIGSAFSNPSSRILLLEGDGGFAQNLQEIGTVIQNSLNVKMFVFSNEGYASIRSGQKSYFNGRYVGCDTQTGLGLPKWAEVCKAYGLKHFKVDSSNAFSHEFDQLLSEEGAVFFEIATDPHMLYFPKVASKILPSGEMVSSAIHDMTPKISEGLAKEVFKYLPRDHWGL